MATITVNILKFVLFFLLDDLHCRIDNKITRHASSIIYTLIWEMYDNDAYIIPKSKMPLLLHRPEKYVNGKKTYRVLDINLGTHTVTHFVQLITSFSFFFFFILGKKEMQFFMRPMFLIKPFNTLIQRISEFGFPIYFKKKTNRILKTIDLESQNLFTGNFEIFTMAEISFAFYIYLIGISLSVFGFLIEHLVYRRIVIY